VLIAPEKGTVQAFDHLDKAATFDATLTTADADAADFDGVVLSGGVANPDFLRMDEAAVGFVRAAARAGKPIASICHGPWTLVEAGVVEGKTLTSWPSLQTDIRNAGGQWRDEQVVQDDSNGFTLITSRNPGDLDAFDEALVSAFAR
jgi:protease I